MRGAPALAVIIVVCAPALALAGPDGTYKFTGDVQGRFDDGALTLEPRADGTFAVTAKEQRAEPVTWDGSGRLEGTVLTIERGNVSIVEALDRSHAGPWTYVCTFDARFERATVRVSSGSTALGTASLEQHRPIWEKLPGELLGLARGEVDRALHKEIDLTREFSVLSYGHIGIRTAAQLLSATDETPFMKESDDAFRAAKKGEPIWIRSVIQGGPRVAYSTFVPLDAAGTVRVDAGFELGAHVQYTCDDQEPRPKSVLDAKGAVDLIEAAPARVFALPLSAERASSLPEGSRRTLEGDGALALSGGISFGYRLEELGALEKKATVGLNGGASVTWNLRGDLRLELEREKANLIHVRWTKSGWKELAAGVEALLGLYVSSDLLAKVPSRGSKVVTAVVNDGEHYTTVEFNASADWLDKSDLVVDMLFDLDDASARAAYERAVIGDLVAVQKLADSKTTSGLKEYRVTSTLTDALSFHARLDAFRVLSASTDRRTTNIHVDVSSLDGASSATDIFDYDRSGHGLFGDSKSLSAEALTRSVLRPSAPAESGQRVTFHFSGRDDHTWKDEMLAQLRLGSLLFGQSSIAREWALVSNDDPGPFHHYGASDMTLDVTLGSRAVEKVLAASYDDLLAAYGRAYWEHDYVWTPDRAALLRKTSLVRKDNPTDADEALRLEAWDLHDAEKVLRLVANARRSGSSSQDRVAAFRDVAKKDGFKLRAVVAFALLGGDDERVAWTLKDSSWLGISLARGSVKPLPEQP